MAEYIEREALKAEFEEDGHLSAYIEEMIDSIPAADVREVKRGKWMFEGSIENTWKVYTCSQCGANCIDGWNFCPNCGEQMDMREEQI